MIHPGHEITSHDGGTGGFRSWIGLDRRGGKGVVLLSADSDPVDRTGFLMLAELPRQDA